MRLEKQGFLLRNDIQYHWLNEDFASFDAFLDTLASRKRKSIRRERRAASEHGISFEWISGGDLREHHWDAFFRFYIDTGSRKWGDPYLNRKFFSLLGEVMAGKIVLIFAMQNGEPVAGALNLIGGNTLYGRYWGTTIDQPFLHFETCYYQAMDYAIQHGIKWVEAGAQGQHKLTRAATALSLPAPPTLSAIRGCEMRSKIISPANAPPLPVKPRRWRPICRSKRMAARLDRKH